jgi:type VI secretion system protein ImpK
MPRTTHAPVPTLRLFQEFYSQLVGLKWIARSPEPAPPTLEANPAQPGAPPVPSSIAVIWGRALGLLESQAAEATRAAGPLGLELHREALYVMAALADEIFVHLDWDGRQYWLANLLEARLFNSHAAGELFFSRLETLLAREDPAATETAAVYLMALGLGFRGRYWGVDDGGALDSYRSRLFFLIGREKPELAAAATRLFPEAYRNTIQAGAARKLSNPRPWILILAGTVALWLLTAQFLWWNLSGPLNDSVSRISGSQRAGCQSPVQGGKK